eukprot:6027021-Pleurochrysis_carterae.AAC.7
MPRAAVSREHGSHCDRRRLSALFLPGSSAARRSSRGCSSRMKHVALIVIAASRRSAARTIQSSQAKRASRLGGKSGIPFHCAQPMMDAQEEEG